MAIAISGAVVIESADGMMRYCFKCDKCGFVEQNTHYSEDPPKIGSMTTKWKCLKCGSINDVIIKG